MSILVRLIKIKNLKIDGGLILIDLSVVMFTLLLSMNYNEARRVAV